MLMALGAGTGRVEQWSPAHACELGAADMEGVRRPAKCPPAARKGYPCVKDPHPKLALLLARLAAEEVLKEWKKAAKGDAAVRLASLMNEEGKQGVVAQFEQVRRRASARTTPHCCLHGSRVAIMQFWRWGLSRDEAGWRGPPASSGPQLSSSAAPCCRLLHAHLLELPSSALPCAAARPSLHRLLSFMSSGSSRHATFLRGQSGGGASLQSGWVHASQAAAARRPPCCQPWSSRPSCCSGCPWFDLELSTRLDYMPTCHWACLLP